jgi:hypothetical protein
MGPQGRGIANNFHVKTSDIDILMDPFTISFGASGGYIAYSKEVISATRILCRRRIPGHPNPDHHHYGFNHVCRYHPTTTRDSRSPQSSRRLRMVPMAKTNICVRLSSRLVETPTGTEGRLRRSHAPPATRSRTPLSSRQTRASSYLDMTIHPSSHFSPSTLAKCHSFLAS